MKRLLLVGLLVLPACGGAPDIADAQRDSVYDAAHLTADEMGITDRTASDGPCHGVIVMGDHGEMMLTTYTALFRDGVFVDLVLGNVLDLVNGDRADCWRD